MSLQDSTLTTIQRQQSETRLRQSLSDNGITYAIYAGDSDSEAKLNCSFTSLSIRDSGVVTDVAPVGHHPIHLSVGKNVSVAFEPRDLTQIDNYESHDLSSARFASLNKGDSFAFSGRLVFCDYFFNRPGGSFFFWVDSDVRVRSVTDWLRKELWGGLPSHLDFIPKKR